MATPDFQVQFINVELIPDSPFSILFPTVGLNGDPVDVSSGYTVKAAQGHPAQDRSLLCGLFQDMSAIGTWTFGATGVTWSATAAQAASYATTRRTYNETAAISISNDSGTSGSRIANLNSSFSLIP